MTYWAEFIYTTLLGNVRTVSCSFQYPDRRRAATLIMILADVVDTTLLRDARAVLY